MRDYTKVPGCEGMTGPQARYNYLHDLMDQYMGLSQEDKNRMEPCKVRTEREDCRYCSFSGFLGGDPDVCCAWRAEAQPDKTIEILEMLVGKTGRKELEDLEMPEKIHKIADHYGLAGQLNQTQEECAELIQAISKFRRAKGLGQPVYGGSDALGHLTDEMCDVSIMLDQLRYLLGNSEAVKRSIGDKLDRQLERIRKETGHEEN